MARDLVLLQRCADNAEASALRALLQSNGIPCVIRGEQHRSMLGMLGAYIDVDVLVPEPQLSAAKEFLAAEPKPDDLDVEPLDLPGATCPVHRGAATGTCERCGAFLCARCEGPPGAGVCSACDERETVAENPRVRRRRIIGWAAVVLFLAPTIAVMLIEAATAAGRWLR